MQSVWANTSALRHITDRDRSDFSLPEPRNVVGV
jgi:hypothetical protein